MSTLEIRHQIVMDGEEFVVREMFGDQKEIEWRVPDRKTADALVDERKAMLMESFVAGTAGNLQIADPIDPLGADHGKPNTR